MLIVENVVSGYRYKPVIKKVSLDLSPGEKMIIYGSAHCGKTTLLKTLSGQLMPISGAVFLNFLPILDYSRNELDKQLYFIPQDFPKTTETVADFYMKNKLAKSPLFYCHKIYENFYKKKLTDLPLFEHRIMQLAAAATRRLVVFDEPFAFLSYREKTLLFNIINSLDKCTFLISETTEAPLPLQGWKAYHLHDGVINSNIPENNRFHEKIIYM